MQDAEHLRLVVEAAPIAIVVADADGAITLVNEQGERLFGYARDELLGRAIEILVPAAFRAAHPELRRGYNDAPATRAMGGGRDLYGLRKDGTEVPIEIGLNPIATQEGSFTLAAIIDITERRRGEEHFRSVVEEAPNAMLMVDRGGAISLVNAQVERLFGYTRAELLGEPLEKLVPERFRAGHGGLRDGFHRSPSARSMGAGRDLFGLRKDGTEVPIEIGLNPLSTPQGEFVLASVIDITERKHAEEMRLQRDRAVDASQLKSQFVATMSHELRTPLNAIIGSAELLSATTLDERQRRFVDTVDRSAEALLSIISSILDFSKIEAGKVDLEERDFELKTVVDAAAALLAPEAREKGVTLHTYVDPIIPPTLRGDQDRLRQILLNLVGNAVKFTERGSIVVRALPVESAGPSARVRFEIRDSGIGISDDDRPKLFEPFVQADSSASRTYGGTGLGLSISKRLVHLMDGQIGVESAPGRGSLFWFTARFGQPSDPPPSQHVSGDAASAAIRHAAGTVLIVEDNASLREILVHQFTQLGIEVTLVSDGVEALEAVRSDDVSLVFMDCHMPNMDGFAATRAIRGLEVTTGGHVPIVAMTANAFKEDRDACLAAGMDDYLSKPVRMSDLRAMTQRWIGAERTLLR